jgi:hypothetical protein
VRVWSDPTALTGFILELTETDVHSGIFQGSLFLGTTTNAGTTELAASVGDQIWAEYEDELDSNGEGPTPRTASLTVEAESDDAGDKVTLCHVPGGNPSNQHTISVGAPARLAHLAHGDSLGECGAVTVDDDHQKQDFCEKRDDHPRCEEQDQLDAETLGAGDDDGKPSGDQAFCERRPDHRKCADVEASDLSGDSHDADHDDGDDDDEEDDD